jgi:nicotinate phosphoribosyltransferase
VHHCLVSVRFPTTALLTDHYELTMLQAALADGLAARPCVFEVFARSLPGRRRYGVFAGVGRLVEAIEAFRFDPDALDFLTATGVVDPASADWLADYRFTGSIDCYAEGEIYFPGSPVAVVQGSFAEAVVLETLVLSVLNFDSAVATAATRMVTAAAGRPIIEMGSRRTHEEAAVAAARAAYLAGFAATSNLAAGRRWSVPTAGTAAHAFTLLHDGEADAFAAQIASLGRDTTLLVDTYDVTAGIAGAVRAAGPGLGAIRLDSGDLPELASQARAQLDSLGATDTRIVVTSDLDEHSIAALAAAPVDGYGVGTSVVTGSGVPTAGFVYKLVARTGRAGMEPVAKTSVGKPSRGGRKWASRRFDAHGHAVAELVHLGAPPDPDAGTRLLQVPLFRDGVRAEVASLAAAREHAARSRGELPPTAFALSPGEPALEVRYLQPGER